MEGAVVGRHVNCVLLSAGLSVELVRAGMNIPIVGRKLERFDGWRSRKVLYIKLQSVVYNCFYHLFSVTYLDLDYLGSM